MLGRDLKDHEVVHHKDKNRKNNSPDNLIVFTDNNSHSVFHRGGCDESLLIRLSDGAYACENTSITTCPQCGKHKDRQAKLCIACHRKNMRANIPEKHTLIMQLAANNGSFVQVGKLYGVSDNAVRKWCKSYGLSFHVYDWKNMS